MRRIPLFRVIYAGLMLVASWAAHADPFMTYSDKAAFRNALQTPYALVGTWPNGGTDVPYEFPASTPAGDFRVRVDVVGLPRSNGRVEHGNTLSATDSRHGLSFEPAPVGSNSLGFPTAFGLDVYRNDLIIGPIMGDVVVTATTTQDEEISVTRNRDTPFAGFIINKLGVYIKRVRVSPSVTSFTTVDNVFVGLGPKPKFALDMPAGDLAAFGDWAVGSTSTARALRIINTTDAEQTMAVQGGGPDNLANFSATDECSGKVVAGGQAACVINYVFHPSSVGLKESTVTLALGDGLTHTFALRGTGIAPSAPGAPVISKFVEGPGQMEFTLATPNDGGSPVTGYDVTCETIDRPNRFGEGPGPVTVTGLEPGVSYACVAKATNALGDGPWSAPAVRFTMALPVPTLGQWSLMLLGLLAAGLGVAGLRRKTLSH